MIKTVPTLGRIAVMALFALSSFGACLYLWMAFGGSSPLRPKGYELHIAFPEATQLANQSDVRISGVSVGKVVKLKPDGNRTMTTLRLQSRFAPIPANTKAILRVKSLLGETYVELTPGNRKAGPQVPDGGTLSPGHVAPTVELDEILSTFDAKTRKAFETWMQSQAAAVQGRGADLNAFFGELPGFTDKFAKLSEILDAQQAAASKTIATTGEVIDAISQREGDLRGLVTSSQRLFSVTAARNDDLAKIFQRLPRFERESSTTLPLLTDFGDHARPAIRQLQPAATAMGPAFAALDKVAPQFDGFFGQLQQVVDASEKGLPAFNRILGNLPPVFDAFQPFLRNVNPIVANVSQSKKEVAGLLANATGATEAYDIGGETLPGTKSNVRYVRVATFLSPESLTFYPRQLGTTRANPYGAPGSLVESLKAGGSIFGSGPCPAGNVALPTAADNDALLPRIQQFAFRTEDRNAVPAPACKVQGNYPGALTSFPQVRAEP
ncbi:MAG: virulence factor Mce family protein [Conexibacter sp.]|nr:virulence factor Mce family protein [Conexibacter sp.]